MQLHPNTPSHNRFNPKFPAKQNIKNLKLNWVLLTMILAGVVFPASIIENLNAGERQLEIACVEQEKQLAELRPKADSIIQNPVLTIKTVADNVFYMGVDNPVSISVEGVPSGLLEPRISGPGNQLIKNPDGGYFVRLSQNQDLNKDVTISVMARIDGQLQNMGSANFKVKMIPDPYAEIAGQTGGNISAETLAEASLISRMKDIDFEINFRITSFIMNTAAGGYFLEQRSISNLLTEDMKNIIRRATPGQVFTFEEIKAVGEDGIVRSLPPMVFRIQEN
jgi:hypothetical protein